MPPPRALLILVSGLLAAACLPAAGGPVSATIEARRKPDRPAKTYVAVGVADLLGDAAAAVEPPALSPYGGLMSRQLGATGCFRVARDGGRWWLIDPDGHPLIRMALNSVYRRVTGGDPDTPRPDLPPRYADTEGRVWAAETVDVLRQLGFNGLGRWSEHDPFTAGGSRLPYTSSLGFMADFGAQLGVTYAKYGHAGYRDKNIPVFHPDFPAFCDDYARRAVAELKDDPWLVGHYTDNEMPIPRKLLAITLGLDPADDALKYNRAEAWRWLRARRGDDVRAQDASTQDGEAWIGHVYHRYYELTAGALRKHDPNHLVLGSRLHGAGPKIPSAVAAAGAHLDVVSINTYGYWQPPDDLLTMWAATTDRPFVISEFCIKGADSDLDNTDGAGWIVPTQRDRGLWYQNFTLKLLESRQCVGWDYFKYRDDLDVNKGVFTVDFKPHADFAAAARELHESAYAVIERLDRTAPDRGGESR